MSTTPTSNTVTSPSPVQVPAARQWSWFAATFGVVLGTSVAVAAFQIGMKALLPALFLPNTLYTNVLFATMILSAIGAIQAGSRRFWLPMTAFILIGIVVLPLAWRLVYWLLFVTH